MLKRTLFLGLGAWLASAMCFGQLVSPGQQHQTSGVPIPSDGKVETISIDKLPAAAKEMVKDKRVTSSPGVIEYANAEEAQLDSLDAMLLRARPIEKMSGKVSVKLARLGPQFNELKLIGIVPEGTTRDGPWTWVSRLFSAADGTIVRLSEWDFAADGGGILLIKEFINQDINGAPATLSLSIAGKSGRALWTLTWVRDGKQYTLDMVAPRRTIEGQNKVLAFARGLSD